MKRAPQVTRQGHWHIDYIRTLGRGRGVRAWEIGTEEKRPHVQGYARYSEDDAEWLRFDIESREGSLGFRDDEDGSACTEVAIPIPRTSWAQRWWRRNIEGMRSDPMWIVVASDDKWAVHVVAVQIG